MAFLVANPLGHRSLVAMDLVVLGAKYLMDRSSRPQILDRPSDQARASGILVQVRRGEMSLRTLVQAVQLEVALLAVERSVAETMVVPPWRPCSETTPQRSRA